MVITMADTAPLPPTTTSTLTTTKTSTITTASAVSCCPSCGDTLPSVEQTQAELLQAHSRIAELESQVRLLNQKATAAVDRWADYEDELSRLRRQDDPPPLPPKNESSPTSNNRSSGGFLQNGTSRLSALLSRNKSSPNLQQQQQQQDAAAAAAAAGSTSRPPTATEISSPPGPKAEDLLRALTREKSLRKEAEGRVAATSREVEELSASLFEQANEMVADERRARAKLEERVDELERRDRDKRRRLERLESAMTRIERVRSLLNE